MATGTRIPEETKKSIVQRVNRGEDVEDLAKEFGFSVKSFPKWKSKFGKSNGRVKRKVTTRKAAPRRNVVQDKIKSLEGQVDFWKTKYTDLLYERNS